MTQPTERDRTRAGRKTRARLQAPSRMRGMSMTMIMLVMGVAIFFGMFAIKAGPVYMENLTVKSIIESTVADEELMRSSKSRVIVQLNQQFRMNNLWDLSAEDVVQVKKNSKGPGYELVLDYERRENLFGNIDLVMYFRDASVDAK